MACQDPTPWCLEDQRTCVQCLGSEHCATATVHQCNPTTHRCECPAGQHNGGDGTCRPLGTCSAGYTQAYADGDQDSVGAGSLVDVCVKPPIPVGYSLTNSDCDDSNVNAWQWMPGYPDLDGDGVTGPLGQVCAGASLPPDHLAEEVLMPYVSFFPDIVVGQTAEGPTWAVQRVGLTSAGFLATMSGFAAPWLSPELRVTGFHFSCCDGVPPVRGVRVRISRRAMGAIMDHSVQLMGSGGVLSDNRASTEPWATTATEVTYGGPRDLWGLDPVTFSQYALLEGVLITVKSNLDTSALASISRVVMELYTSSGSPDPNDQDPTVFAAWTVWTDADRDGYGIGGITNRHRQDVGAEPIPGFVETGMGDDCDDGNADVHPHQELFFNTPTPGGSWDYDCNTRAEKKPWTIALGCDTTQCIPTPEEIVAPTCDCGTDCTQSKCGMTDKGCQPVQWHIMVGCH